MKQLLAGAFALVSTLVPVTIAQVSPAQAISLGTLCSATVAGRVSPTLGCQIGTDNNDKVQGGNRNFVDFQVNQDSIFGYNNWLLAGKDETNGTINISSQFPNAQSGTFDISSLVQPNWSEIMLVFKGGSGDNISPGNYVSYLLRQNSLGALSGNWASPFVNTRNRQLAVADVSHISLYYRTAAEATPIPTPALLPAAVGMSAALFRQKKRQAEAAQKA